MISLLGDAVLALTCSAYNDGKVRTSQNLVESLCARDTPSLAKPLPIFIQLIYSTDYQVGTLRMTTCSHPPPNHEQTNVAKCPSIFFLDNYTYATTATTAATTATGGAAAGGGGASAVPVARHRVAIQTIVSSNRSAAINSRATTSSATKAEADNGRETTWIMLGTDANANDLGHEW